MSTLEQQRSNTGTGGDDDELSSLKERLRKKESDLEDQKFFLNDCDADMKTQIEEDIASYEKEIEELKQKIQDKEKEEENSSNWFSTIIIYTKYLYTTHLDSLRLTLTKQQIERNSNEKVKSPIHRAR